MKLNGVKVSDIHIVSGEENSLDTFIETTISVSDETGTFERVLRTKISKKDPTVHLAIRQFLEAVQAITRYDFLEMVQTEKVELNTKPIQYRLKGLRQEVGAGWEDMGLVKASDLLDEIHTHGYDVLKLEMVVE
jgi:hypothetical protein